MRYRRPERSDLGVILGWFAEPSYREFLFGNQTGQTLKTREQVLTLLGGSMSMPVTGFGFLLLEDEAEGPVGLIVIYEMQWRNRLSSSGIYLSERYRTAERYAEACVALCQFSFGDMNLHRVGIRIPARDEAACDGARMAGAAHEAVLRGHLAGADGPEDLHAFGILREEFEMAGANHGG